MQRKCGRPYRHSKTLIMLAAAHRVGLGVRYRQLEGVVGNRFLPPRHLIPLRDTDELRKVAVSMATCSLDCGRKCMRLRATFYVKPELMLNTNSSSQHRLNLE